MLFPTTEHAPFDLGCIYCPDTGDCYYLDPRSHRVSVTLRITPSRNGRRTTLEGASLVSSP